MSQSPTSSSALCSSRAGAVETVQATKPSSQSIATSAQRIQREPSWIHERRRSSAIHRRARTGCDESTHIHLISPTPAQVPTPPIPTPLPAPQTACIEYNNLNSPDASERPPIPRNPETRTGSASGELWPLAVDLGTAFTNEKDNLSTALHSMLHQESLLHSKIRLLESTNVAQSEEYQGVIENLATANANLERNLKGLTEKCNNLHGCVGYLIEHLGEFMNHDTAYKQRAERELDAVRSKHRRLEEDMTEFAAIRGEEEAQTLQRTEQVESEVRSVADMLETTLNEVGRLKDVVREFERRDEENRRKVGEMEMMVQDYRRLLDDARDSMKILEEASSLSPVINPAAGAEFSSPPSSPKKSPPTRRKKEMLQGPKGRTLADELSSFQEPSSESSSRGSVQELPALLSAGRLASSVARSDFTSKDAAGTSRMPLLRPPSLKNMVETLSALSLPSSPRGERRFPGSSTPTRQPSYEYLIKSDGRHSANSSATPASTATPSSTGSPFPPRLPLQRKPLQRSDSSGIANPHAGEDHSGGWFKRWWLWNSKQPQLLPSQKQRRSLSSTLPATSGSKWERSLAVAQEMALQTRMARDSSTVTAATSMRSASVVEADLLTSPLLTDQRAPRTTPPGELPSTIEPVAWLVETAEQRGISRNLLRWKMLASPALGGAKAYMGDLGKNKQNDKRVIMKVGLPPSTPMPPHGGVA